MSDNIIKHLEDIQHRLSRIENRLGIPPAEQSSAPLPEAAPEAAIEKPVFTAPAPFSPPPASVPVSAVVDTQALDEWADDTHIKYEPSAPQSDVKPTNWLGYAAIICFVLAAGFIIKLSIDSGWLTPVKQIGLSALLGGSLIAAGLKFLKADREYASLLPGAGIIILYLTSFAAHRYYDLISFETAILTTALVSALCIWLYIKIKHDIYAITACIGTYLSPVVLNMHADSNFTLSYFLVCSLAFAVISIFIQSRVMILVSAYLAIFITTIIGLDIREYQFVSVVLALQFLIFAFTTFFYSRRNGTPLTTMEAWSFTPVLLVFYAAEYNFIDHISPNLAPWVALWFAAILSGIYLAARKLFPAGLASQGLIVSFATLALFHAGYIELLPSAMHPWLLAALPLVAAFIPSRFLASANEKKDTIFFLPVLAVGIIVPIEYVSLMVHLFDRHDASYIWPALATVSTMWVLMIAKSSLIRDKAEIYYGVLAATHALAILALYRFAEDIGSLAVSASWLFYAVATMIFATQRKDEVMAKSALFVLAFAAGKALLYDAASAPSLIRIFCLLLTGAVLYGCGFLLRRISAWQDPSPKV